MPYPPNKGDKIRSYHLVKHLAQRYHVHLGTFVDDPSDWQHVDTVKKLCSETHFAALHPTAAKLRSLGALLGDRALSLDYYRDADLKTWVDQLMKSQPISKILVFSSPMAQYAEAFPQVRRVIDFVDIDSDKWRQYADSKMWPMSWLYRREGTQLLRYERQVALDFDASLFVSHAEAALFKKLAPESVAKTGFFNNGVDTDYFSPVGPYTNPYASNETPIVFTGAMDYWPNIDAVQWFGREIMPEVLVRNPGTVFYIVGSRPSSQVQALTALPGVRVTGSVPDVRPYIAHARISVAPLRIARGIQNKVLEAMAMAKPVVVSPQALEGIDAKPGSEVILADSAEQFVSAISALLQSKKDDLGPLARNKVESRYAWSSNLSQVDRLLDASSHPISAEALP